MVPPVDSPIIAPDPRRSTRHSRPPSGDGAAVSPMTLAQLGLRVVPDSAAPLAPGGTPPPTNHAALAAALHARGRHHLTSARVTPITTTREGHQ